MSTQRLIRRGIVHMILYLAHSIIYWNSDTIATGLTIHDFTFFLGGLPIPKCMRAYTNSHSAAQGGLCSSSSELGVYGSKRPYQDIYLFSKRMDRWIGVGIVHYAPFMSATLPQTRQRYPFSSAFIPPGSFLLSDPGGGGRVRVCSYPHIHIY